MIDQLHPYFEQSIVFTRHAFNSLENKIVRVKNQQSYILEFNGVDYWYLRLAIIDETATLNDVLGLLKYDIKSIPNSPKMVICRNHRWFTGTVDQVWKFLIQEGHYISSSDYSVQKKYSHPTVVVKAH